MTDAHAIAYAVSDTVGMNYEQMLEVLQAP